MAFNMKYFNILFIENRNAIPIVLNYLVLYLYLDPNTAKTIQILPPEQKLNVFQIMMFNARKQK